MMIRTMNTPWKRLCLLLHWLFLASSLPTSQDVGLCGVSAGLNWTTERGYEIPHNGWTCTPLGYAISPCAWTGVVCSLNKVVTINLHFEGLTGTLSPFVGNLTSLKALRLDVNSINGTFPSMIGYLTSLQYLGISTNRFSGSLPSEIGNLVNLKYFLTYNNLFTGAIPSSFCQLTALTKFYPCDSNGMGCNPSACIPSCITNLNTSANYAQLSFCTPGPTSVPTMAPTNNDSFPTEAPTTVYPPSPAPSVLPSMAPYLDPSLNLLQNTAMCILQSSINWVNPSGGQAYHSGWSCNASNVAVNLCSMGGNRWTGISCDTSGRVTGINLFNLNLRGNLPREIGYLTGLSSLDLHMNSFTGMVPTDLGLLQSLQYLALSDNSFAGTIPSQLGTLPNLQSLYLFGNKFTGTLPSSLCSGTQQLQKFFPCNGIGSAKCRDLTGCAPSCLSNVTRYNIGILNFCSTMPTNSPTAAPT